MKLDDYSKYYIQGSDHYLIPTNDFIEFVEEKLELKKQLHEASLTIQEMVEQDIECPSTCDKLRKITSEQKEFVNWLENVIQKVRNTEFLDEIMQRAGLIAYNRCLQKYKTIIGDDKE